MTTDLSPHAGAAGVSRRQFLHRCGALGAAIAALPQALAQLGWLDDAAAATLDVTRDTINALVAFAMPGADEYSRAQGVTTDGPGGIAAGATEAIIDTFDRALPAPLVGGSTGLTLPGSAAVAQMLNGYALQVDPAASKGPFASPFARLSHAQKSSVFQRMEADPAWDGTSIRNLAALLPGAPAFLGFSEAGVLRRGRLAATPVGWRLSGYSGPSDGWDELKGYWGGRRAARGAHRFVRHRHPRSRRSRSRRHA